ncbi:2-oxoglutarate-dependent dioxygenase 19-like [Prosopis cineraria]|uniref:2-oxoglutarate-dependent dioxygenase 19-like n=1 Tax=Prosopis cineraria TaxID=364024 RepID=UPI00240F7BE2|nr:2-oxoglutarate-dependent dioxygenase 19-like [Prosopis cineraria]
MPTPFKNLVVPVKNEASSWTHTSHSSLSSSFLSLPSVTSGDVVSSSETQKPRTTFPKEYGSIGLGGNEGENEEDGDEDSHREKEKGMEALLVPIRVNETNEGNEEDEKASRSFECTHYQVLNKPIDGCNDGDGNEEGNEVEDGSDVVDDSLDLELLLGKYAIIEYNKRIKDVARTLLKGISESLGLQPNIIIESTGFESSRQTCQVNLYPPCPQPNLTLGLLPHSNNGLLTLLIGNRIKGLQVKHYGKWVNVNPLPHCLLANIEDQLEIVSNKRYRSMWHRVVVNERDSRLSFALKNGPTLDKEIGPAIGLLEKEKPLFKSINYKEYLQVQQEARIVDKRGLDMIYLHNVAN